MSNIPIKQSTGRPRSKIKFSFFPLILLVSLGQILAQSVSISPETAPIPVATPSVRIEFDTVSDKFYRIESSEDLTNWKPEGYAFSGNGQRMSALVSNHGLPRLFYRIRNNATSSETAPVIPYAAVAQSGSPSTPAPITAAEFDPANDRLVLMDSRSSGSGMRSISLSELAKIPGYATRWGEIQGSISDQADLMAALNGKFSATNPPTWQTIINKPTTLFGYGIADAFSTSSIGFMDRFFRYAEGSVIVNNSTYPEVGNAWRYNITGKSRLDVSTLSVVSADSSYRDSANGFLGSHTTIGDVYVMSGFSNPANNRRIRVASVTAGKITVTTDTGAPVSLVDEPAGAPRRMTGGYPPFIANGALRGADKTLFYIGAPTRTQNGRFTITFEVELKPSIYPSGQFGAAITLGIKPSELLLPQGGLNLGNLIHCQIIESGILANGIYGLLPAFDPVEGSHPATFVPGQSFPKNVKHLIQCVVEGEEMRVSSRGGTIVYRDPRIARMIGNPDTHWFYETNGDSLGNNLYANVFHLHRIWVNAPVLDQAPGWGITETLQVNSNATSVLAAVQTPLDPAASLATPVSGKAGQKIQLATISCGLLPSVGSHAKTTVHGNFPTGSPKTLVLQRQGIEIWSSGNLNDSGEWTLETQYVRQGPESYQLHIRYGSDATRRSGFHSLSTIDSSGLSFDLKGTSGNDGDIVVRSALNHAPQP